MLPTLMLLAALGATEIAPGLYYVVPIDSARLTATGPDGSTIGLSAMATENIGHVQIRSDANDNSKFRILVHQAGPIGGGRPQNLALAAGRTAIPLLDDSRDENTHKFTFCSKGHIDSKFAQRLATALKIKTLPRIHPGHRARVTWRPVKPSYRIGEVPVLELEIENVGTVPIQFVEGGRQRGARDNQFAFVAMRSSGSGKAIPDTGNPIHFGGLGGFRTIEPGQTWTKQVTLDRWFQFSEADTYQITGIYRVELLPTTQGNSPPASQGPVWDEFFTGECLVKMTKD